MRSASYFVIRVPTPLRFMPRSTLLPCVLWPFPGQEAPDENDATGSGRLSFAATQLGFQVERPRTSLARVRHLSSQEKGLWYLDPVGFAVCDTTAARTTSTMDGSSLRGAWVRPLPKRR